MDVLDNCDINDKEVNKGQLTVKLLKRKIECLLALNQYKKGKACLEDLLELSNNVYKIPLEGNGVIKIFYCSLGSKFKGVINIVNIVLI